MVIAGRIQRYIFRQSLNGLMLTLGVIVLAIVLVDVVEQMRTVGSRADIDILTAFRLTMLKTPALLNDTLPFAMLVGSIMTFSQLSRRSEIPAIRAAGVSAWRFLGPAMVLAGVIGVLMVAVIDPLATRLQSEFEAQRDRIINYVPEGVDAVQGVWLSQGDLNAGSELSEDGAAIASVNPNSQAIIHAEGVVGRAEALEGVTFYYFSPGPGGVRDREFTHRIDAERARLVSGFWQLEGVVENRFGGDVQRYDQLALPTNLRAETLLSRFAGSDRIPFWELPQFIGQNSAAGMNVDAYKLKFHTLLATPVMMIAMTLIGAVVCLRLARAGGLSKLIGAGALSGFLLFFATRISAGLASTGATTPEAAAWCPPLFALFAVLTLLTHAEDG